MYTNFSNTLKIIKIKQRDHIRLYAIKAISIRFKQFCYLFVILSIDDIFCDGVKYFCICYLTTILLIYQQYFGNLEIEEKLQN